MASLYNKADNYAFDAFGRRRVSNPKTLLSLQNEYQLNTLSWNTKKVGGATIAYQSAESSVLLESTTAKDDRAILQSKLYTKYQPGKSHQILITFNFEGSTTGCTKRVGYFDDHNGIFFQNDGDENSFIVRTNTSGSVVETKISQSDWNIDTLNGCGYYDDKLDISKAQILFIDFEWLGAGRVRVGFVINGIIYYTHFFNFANDTLIPYMRTPNLPIRYEIENVTAISSAETLRAICASVNSEGGVDNPQGYPFSAKNSGFISATDTLTPILSIRPKTTFNSLPNRIESKIKDIIAFSVDGPIIVYVIYNGTLTNASFASVDTESSMEYDESATAISGGIELKHFFVAANSQGNQEIPSQSSGGSLERIVIGLDIDGANPDIITIAALRMTTTSSDTWATINWIEEL